MKLFIYGFFMAWGMFLAIPCPFRRWDEAARGRMLGFLPLIGLIVGAIWAAAAHLCTALNLPSAVRALILCALPWLVTGFLHLDGFMDVCDAVLSRRDLETRQRILKDSHCGSFAVICMILLAAAQWSLFFSFESFDFKALLTLAVLPACTRACSGIAVQTLKPMQTSQYSGAVRSAASVVSLFVQLALFLVLPPLLCGKVGSAPIAAVAVYWICILREKKQLGGMNGDISGFSLTLAELAGIAALLLFDRM